MGLYQICPGDPVYQITSPVFNQVTIHLDPGTCRGKSFTIKTNNYSKENYYIQSATLNGNPLNRSWIKHDEITAGGKLELVMGNQPNKKWGSD
jgi:putative alpha-1,2-mannosidase